MQEEKTPNSIKSFIVSVNGEGLTIDICVKFPSDFEVLDALINKIKNQCKSNNLRQPDLSIPN